MMTTILGIDPGVSETGWAVLCGEAGAAPRLADSGLIKTLPSQPLPERLCLIHGAVARLVERHLRIQPAHGQGDADRQRRGR